MTAQPQPASLTPMVTRPADVTPRLTGDELRAEAARLTDLEARLAAEHEQINAARLATGPGPARTRLDREESAAWTLADAVREARKELHRAAEARDREAAEAEARDRRAVEEMRRLEEGGGPELPADPTGVDCAERYEGIEP